MNSESNGCVDCGTMAGEKCTCGISRRLPKYDSVGRSIGDGQQPDNLAGVRQIAELSDLAYEIRTDIWVGISKMADNGVSVHEQLFDALSKIVTLAMELESVRRSETQDA